MLAFRTGTFYILKSCLTFQSFFAFLRCGEKYDSKYIVVCVYVVIDCCFYSNIFYLFQQSCWNCGRKASETCSGCNTARYCGSFCQHKDWENHHHVCGKASLSALSQPRDTPPQTVSLSSPQVPSSPHPHSSPSPVNSVSSVKSVSRSSTPADMKQTEARAAEVSR